MLKTRLATNIDGHPLRFVLLFKQAYSNGADLILSCLNTNEEVGPGLAHFLFFRQKIVLRPKIAKIVHLWHSSWAHVDS